MFAACLVSGGCVPSALYHPRADVRSCRGTLIALGFAVYVIFSTRGASSAAKLQAFPTKALLCGMLLAMGVSLFTGSPTTPCPCSPRSPVLAAARLPMREHQPVRRHRVGPGSDPVLHAGFRHSFLSRLRKQPRASTGTSSARSSPSPAGRRRLLLRSASTRSAPSSTGMKLVKSPVPALACLKGINMLRTAMLVIATLGPMGPMNSSMAPRAASCLPWAAGASCPRIAEVDPPSPALPSSPASPWASSPSSVRSWARTCSFL